MKTTVSGLVNVSVSGWGGELGGSRVEGRGAQVEAVMEEGSEVISYRRRGPAWRETQHV